MKAYHSMNHLHRLAKRQEKEAKSRTETTQIQLSKISDKIRKLEKDICTARDDYKEALRDIGNYNPKYKDDMEYEYSKCQIFEETRRKVTKEKLCQFQSCINRTIFTEKYEFVFNNITVGFVCFCI